MGHIYCVHKGNHLFHTLESHWSLRSVWMKFGSISFFSAIGSIIGLWRSILSFSQSMVQTSWSIILTINQNWPKITISICRVNGPMYKLLSHVMKCCQFCLAKNRVENRYSLFVDIKNGNHENERNEADQKKSHKKPKNIKSETFVCFKSVSNNDMIVLVLYFIIY